MIALQCLGSFLALAVVGWLFWNRTGLTANVTYDSGREEKRTLLIFWPVALILAIALIAWLWWG